jgi:hypothetical protein
MSFRVSSVSVVVGPKVFLAIQLRINPEKANQKGRVSVTGVRVHQQHTDMSEMTSKGTSVNDGIGMMSTGTQLSEHLHLETEGEHSRQLIEV